MRTVIDLTHPDHIPRVAMITRFPPSESGSAMAALDLSRQLAQRGFALEVVRLVLPGEASAKAGRPVVMDVNAHWAMCPRIAAGRANRCDIAVVQIDRHVPIQLIDELLSELEVPVVLAVDDVGSVEPDDTLFLAGAVMRAQAVVVPSETARRQLSSITEDSVEIDVIPPGSPWQSVQPGARVRRQILSWGYLAPGMGAERVIRSLAQLGDLEPKPRYRLIGVTDPGWTQQEGAMYRAALVEEAERLGVQDQLEIVPILHSRKAMEKEIARSDVIAVVYDSRERVSSRILAEAVSTGRPVVATAFPAAIEMLASGAGLTVDHDDPDAMTAALKTLLTDDHEYLSASRAAASMSRELGVEETARRYASLLHRRLGDRPLSVITS
ncbi:MAG TPA: glycosyltransferase [Acidimicrobiia bacterium]